MSKRLIRPGLWLCGVGLFVLLAVWLVNVLGPARTSGNVPNPAPTPTPAASQEKIEEIPLSEAERQYLWECEHHGQLLSQRGFKQFSRALRDADRAALLAVLAEDFTGSVYRRPFEVRLPGDFARVVREQDQGEPATPLSREQFVAKLLEYRKEFAQPPQVQISLMTLSPQKRADLDSTWETKCVLRLWGESAPQAPAEITLAMLCTLSRPSDAGFAAGKWLRSSVISQVALAKSPQPLMREVAAERGVDARIFHDNWTTENKIFGGSGGVFLFDYNRDGYLDMLIQDAAAGCILYTGGPDGKLKPSRLSPWRHPVAVADFDGDGWDDLLLGDRIIVNRPGGRNGREFKIEGPSQQFPTDVSGAHIADYDRDGRLDIYFTRSDPGPQGSWISGHAGHNKSNQLFRNKGNLAFEDVTEKSGTAWSNHSCFSAVWFDADNDGWPDLYVINEFGNGALLRNQGDGTFREIKLSEGPADFGSMGVIAGDIDNDGNIDLYTANMYSKAGSRVLGNLSPNAYAPEVMATMRRFVTGSQLWRNTGGLKFEQRGAQWQVAAVGWAYGAALADLDNDGFLDIYATAGFFSVDRSEPDG